MSSLVTGFQLFSVKVWLGSVRRSSSSMAAKEEVTITLLTLGAECLMALRMEVVPIRAGSTISVWGSAVRGTQLGGVLSIPP